MLRPSEIPVIPELEAASAQIWAEAQPLGRFIPMLSGSMYRGGWNVFLFQAGPWGGEFPGVDFAANLRDCPTAGRILAAHPEIGVFGILSLEPGAELLPHSDHRDDHEIRVHIALAMPLELTAWPLGTARLLDIREEHSGKNPYASPRVTLVADVRLANPVASGDIPAWDAG